MIIMEISCIGKNVFSYKLVVVMNLSKISLWTITKLPCESDTKYVVISIQHSIFTSIQSYKQLYMYHISTKQTYKKHRRTLWLDCQHGSFSAGKGIGKWDNLLLWNLAKLILHILEVWENWTLGSGHSANCLSNVLNQTPVSVKYKQNHLSKSCSVWTVLALKILKKTIV